MNRLISLLAALALAAPLHAEPVAAPVAEAAALSEGVVRKVDAANAKVTLRHGPIANLDMPPMTMVFRAQPPALLNGIRAGDTVRFRAELVDGTYTVTAIEPLP